MSRSIQTGRGGEKEGGGGQAKSITHKFQERVSGKGKKVGRLM